jgi:hypothetical protein
LFAKSEIAIPEGAAAGGYRMQVMVSEGASPRAGKAASEWTDLEIGNPVVPAKP